MGFLDRFKPQPKWKHPDAAVRAAAVEAVPDDEQDLLRSIALEDPEPAVRRIALARVSDPDVLARIARSDSDDAVRAEAREIVLGFAQDSTDAELAARALAGLEDSRELAIVARSAELEPIALGALERLQESRIVAVVARQASHAAVRLAAVARVKDPDDLLAIATKSEHKDAAVAAVDRLGTREALDAVAFRARNKVAARRARSAIRSLEEAERVPRQQASRRVELTERVEGLVHATNLQQAERTLADAETEWQALAQGAEPAVAARFADAVTGVRALLARSEADRAEHERQARALAEEMAQASSSRLALCEKLEALEGENAAAGLDEARTIWVALAPWPDTMLAAPQVRQVEDRFARAVAECERRIARAAESESRRANQQTVVEQAEAAVVVADYGAARTQFDVLRRQWAQVAGGGADAALADRFKACEESMSQRDAASRAARLHEAARNRERLERLAAQAERLAAAEEIGLKDVERIVRETRAAVEHPGALPSRQDHDAIVHRLQAAHAALSPRLQELREADDWRRWANASVQEELCAKAEGLREVEDLSEVARQVRDLQQQWKKVGAAPRERAQALWQRFRTAVDDARQRAEGFYAEQRAAEAGNLQQKEAICARAEALAQSTDWIKTADTMKRLQAEWQTVGPVPHEQAKVLWQRFRTACDTFFTRRKTDLAERKHAWSENLQRKEALCARAEELARSDDWDAAAGEMKRLQAEWKSIGPVKKNRSEALWQRFRGACDTFFERYKHREDTELGTAVRAREALVLEAEQAAASGPAPADDAPAEGSSGPATGPVSAEPVPAVPADPARILDLWTRWQQAPRLPRPMGESLDQRFERALGRVLERSPDIFRGTRLDVEANLKRMEKLCVEVEGLLAGRVSVTDLASAAPETLASLLKDRLASNTIGGRVDEEARQRAATTAVRDAQAAWRRIVPVPTERGRQLAARFHRACRRFFEQTPNPPVARPTHV